MADLRNDDRAGQTGLDLGARFTVKVRVVPEEPALVIPRNLELEVECPSPRRNGDEDIVSAVNWRNVQPVHVQVCRFEQVVDQLELKPVAGEQA